MTWETSVIDKRKIIPRDTQAMRSGILTQEAFMIGTITRKNHT